MKRAILYGIIVIILVFAALIKVGITEKGLIYEIFNKTYTTEITKAKVIYIVDGDTIKVQINNKTYKVRLIGVDTPEMINAEKEGENLGQDATNYTKQILYVGREIWLTKDISETDKYGRLLRYVWIGVPNNYSKDEIRDRMFNAMLVIKGFAKAKAYPPDTEFAEVLEELEKEAR
ncbi:MAG TPA: nuclease [Clostridiales bacterium]|nr:MAG: hypothetical protein A2Y22_08855 [Clostridiales bacterium GWD2_32_59]HAN10026.1 nuclease [Clostridiales bacterium]